MNNVSQMIETGVQTFEQMLQDLDPKFKELNAYERDILEAATSAVKTASAIQREIVTGWDELGSDKSQLFTIEKLREIRTKARKFSFGSPLVVAVVEVYQLLVHAKGRTITANDDTLQAVIRNYLTLNNNAIFGQLQRMERERDLWTDSQLHFIHFTGDDTAETKTRFVAANEWEPYVTNPEDRTELWFHVREINSTKLDGTPNTYLAIHPDFEFNVEAAEQPTYEESLKLRYKAHNVKVYWDRPVKLLQLNSGVSKLFPILSWVECYERLLNMVATVYAAISAVALVTRTKAEYVKKVAAELKKTKDSANPSANSVVLEGDIKTLNAKSALLGGNDFDPFLYQIAMVVQLPPHAFGRAEPATGLSDGQNSNELMRLAIQARQSLWEALERDLINYAIIQAVKKGDLKGKGEVKQIAISEDAYIERVEWKEGFDPSYKITYPSVRTIDLEKAVKARIAAHTLDGKQPNPDISSPKEYYTDIMPLLGRVNNDDRVKELPEVWGSAVAPEEGGVAESNALKLLESFTVDLREALQGWEHIDAYEGILNQLKEGRTVRLLPSLKGEVYENGQLLEEAQITIIA